MHEQRVEPQPSVRKGLLRGLSSDAAKTEQFSEEMKCVFIQNLVSPSKRDRSAVVVDFMSASVRSLSRVPGAPDLLEPERFVIAALLKQLGFVNAALAYASKIFGDKLEASRPPFRRIAACCERLFISCAAICFERGRNRATTQAERLRVDKTISCVRRGN
jgi:hypothetical protein